MSRDWRLYWDDIGESCERIERYVSGMNRETFQRDEKTRDAVLRNLEIIGEAAKRIPSSVRDDHGTIDWRRIAGLRDILAHAYFGIDENILWDIVQNKIPELSHAIKRRSD